MRLLNWDIDFRVAHSMEIDGSVGRCAWNLLNLHATIWILDPRENTSMYASDNNVDLTIVHELVHLWVSPLLPKGVGTIESSMQEAAIEMLAQAIVGG